MGKCEVVCIRSAKPILVKGNFPGTSIQDAKFKESKIVEVRKYLNEQKISRQKLNYCREMMVKWLQDRFSHEELLDQLQKSTREDWRRNPRHYWVLTHALCRRIQTPPTPIAG
ncbi:MAG: hypothetical protein V4473_00585 [Patescibacteria group bacterium]